MNSLEQYIRDVPDFPKEGVLFKDITPLLSDVEASQRCLNMLLENIGNQKIDKVVGIESRGFLFGMQLAQKLNAGFVPVRKPGKLPYKTMSQSYELEYGTDTLEIHADAIDEGEYVLIHDDILATGGTAEAVCKLVEKLKGNIVQCNFVIELSFLNGKQKISDYNVTSIITY